MRKKTQNSREATIQNSPAKGSLLFIAPCNHSSHPLLLASLVFPTPCTPKYPYADCRQVDPYTMLGTFQGLCQHTIPVLPCSSKTQEKGFFIHGFIYLLWFYFFIHGFINSLFHGSLHLSMAPRRAFTEKGHITGSICCCTLQILFLPSSPSFS